MKKKLIIVFSLILMLSIVIASDLPHVQFQGEQGTSFYFNSTSNGTANYIPKFYNSTYLTNSMIYETNDKIGINTLTPSEELEVYGAIKSNQIIASGTGTHPSIPTGYIELYMSGNIARILPYTGNSYLDLAIGDWNGGDANIYLKTGGNVGINNGNPSYQLDVKGIIKTDEKIIIEDYNITQETGDLYIG